MDVGLATFADDVVAERMKGGVLFEWTVSRMSTKSMMVGRERNGSEALQWLEAE